MQVLGGHEERRRRQLRGPLQEAHPAVLGGRGRVEAAVPRRPERRRQRLAPRRLRLRGNALALREEGQAGAAAGGVGRGFLGRSRELAVEGTHGLRGRLVVAAEVRIAGVLLVQGVRRVAATAAAVRLAAVVPQTAEALLLLAFLLAPLRAPVLEPDLERRGKSGAGQEQGGSRPPLSN